MHNLCPFTFVYVLEVLVRWNNAGLEDWLTSRPCLLRQDRVQIRGSTVTLRLDIPI